MNLTVGPEPAAVYWRRRALVAAPILAILLSFTACMVKASGSGGGDTPVATASSASSGSSPPPASTGSTPATSPSARNGTAQAPWIPGPGASPSSPAPGIVVPTAATSPQESPGSTQAAAAAQPAAPTTCPNSALSLTAVPGDGSFTVGEYPRLELVVANRSPQACYRDLGSGQQELKVVAGTRRIWSSDDCASAAEADRRLVQPGEKRTYHVVWNGRTSTPGCGGSRAQVGPGSYQLIARLGTLTSAPAGFTISR